jgi:hypothetical protein
MGAARKWPDLQSLALISHGWCRASPRWDTAGTHKGDSIPAPKVSRQFPFFLGEKLRRISPLIAKGKPPWCEREGRRGPPPSRCLRGPPPSRRSVCAPEWSLLPLSQCLASTLDARFFCRSAGRSRFIPVRGPMGSTWRRLLSERHGTHGSATARSPDGRIIDVCVHWSQVQTFLFSEGVF